MHTSGVSLNELLMYEGSATNQSKKALPFITASKQMLRIAVPQKHMYMHTILLQRSQVGILP
jgi:hypothetical protein